MHREVRPGAQAGGPRVQAALTGRLGHATESVTAALPRAPGCAQDLTELIVAAALRMDVRSWDEADCVRCEIPKAHRSPFKLITPLTGAKRPPGNLASAAVREGMLTWDTVPVEGGPGSGKTTLAVAIAAAHFAPAAVYHSIGAQPGSRADAMLHDCPLLQTKSKTRGDYFDDEQLRIEAAIRYVCQAVKEAVPEQYRNPHDERLLRHQHPSYVSSMPESRSPPPFVLILDDVDYAKHDPLVFRLIRDEKKIAAGIRLLLGLDRKTPVRLILAGAGAEHDYSHLVRATHRQQQ